MKPKFIDAYMDVAERFGQLSTARRLNVGAIIVKDNRIISIGYNGMPSGWDNNCEIELDEGELKSKPEVLHAESNAIVQAARHGIRIEDSEIFVTASPCYDCFKMIANSGINKIYFGEFYRDERILEHASFLNIELINLSD